PRGGTPNPRCESTQPHPHLPLFVPALTLSLLWIAPIAMRDGVPPVCVPHTLAATPALGGGTHDTASARDLLGGARNDSTAPPVPTVAATPGSCHASAGE